MTTIQLKKLEKQFLVLSAVSHRLDVRVERLKERESFLEWGVGSCMMYDVCVIYIFYVYVLYIKIYVFYKTEKKNANCLLKIHL